MNENNEHPQHLRNRDIVKAFGKKHKATMVFVLDILLNLVIIIAMVILIRSYLISPFQVFGGSMCDTLNNINGVCQKSYGEYIIVNKLGYQNFFGWQVGMPQRGDIIVFHPPLSQDEFFIKRVIGLPGETVKLQDGFVYIINKEHPTGIKLEEPYLNATNLGHTCLRTPFPTCDPGVFEVPEGQYFAMGDNRNNSSDSRSCFNEGKTNIDCGQPGNTNFLKMSNLEGKAWLILWPLSKLEALGDTKYGI